MKSLDHSIIIISIIIIIIIKHTHTHLFENIVCFSFSHRSYVWYFEVMLIVDLSLWGLIGLLCFSYSQTKENVNTFKNQ